MSLLVSAYCWVLSPRVPICPVRGGAQFASRWPEVLKGPRAKADAPTRGRSSVPPSPALSRYCPGASVVRRGRTPRSRMTSWGWRCTGQLVVTMRRIRDLFGRAARGCVSLPHLCVGSDSPGAQGSETVCSTSLCCVRGEVANPFQAIRFCGGLIWQRCVLSLRFEFIICSSARFGVGALAEVIF